MRKKPTTTSNTEERIAALLEKGKAAIASVPFEVVIVSKTLEPDFVTVFPNVTSAALWAMERPVMIVRDEE